MPQSILYLNTSGDTISELATVLNVEGYKCGVVNIAGTIPLKVVGDSKRLFLCSDICDVSFVNNTQLPILRELFRNQKGKLMNNIFNVLWVNILRPEISSVRMYICNEKGKILSLEESSVECTLLIV